jgi:uncharacterized protein (TIGR02246 family)
MKRAILLFAVIGFGASWAVAQETPAPPPSGDSAEISAAVKSYVSVFNRGDANAMASYWTEDAVFVAPSGEKYEGRQAIQEGFESFFKDNDGAKIEIDIASITFEEADVAVEQGTSRVILADESVSETTYEARYKKEGGSWKLTSVRESLPVPSHYEQLQSLEWMIGEWGDSENSSVQTACRWTKNNNFISRSFAVSLGDQVDLEGTQVIGWDPDKQVIRSWLFDSDGGFAVGLWKQKDKQWKIQSLHVLPDGRKASSVNLLTQVDENTFTWESTGRAVDGEILPNLGPVTVKRKGADK